MKIILRALKEIGLNTTEIAIFRMILENQTQNITIWAQKIGVSRPSIYKGVAKLKSQKLVYEIDGIYKIKSLSEIQNRLKLKTTELNNLVDNMETTLDNYFFSYLERQDQKVVKIYTGIQTTAKKLLQYSREKFSFVKIYGNLDFFDFLGSYNFQIWQKWLDKSLQNQTKVTAYIDFDLDIFYRHNLPRDLLEHPNFVRKVVDSVEANKTAFSVSDKYITIWDIITDRVIQIKNTRIAQDFESILAS